MNELVVINPAEYGLEETKANVIAEAFREPLAELAALETEYKEFENLTGKPPESTCEAAKELFKKYQKNRKTREAIHKTEKSYFWNAGKYVDAWKNKALEVSDERETKLKEIADYYVNLEKERIAKLGEDRKAELLKCQIDDEMYIPPGLGEMPDEAWGIYLDGVQKKYNEHQEEIEKQRIEKEAEEKRQREEQERIKQENEKLKAEAEAREKAAAKERAAQEKKLAAERAEREKLEQEKQEREEAEARAKAEEEERKQKAAAAPDKDKLHEFAKLLDTIQKPIMSTNGATKIIDKAFHDICDIVEWIKEETEKL